MYVRDIAEQDTERPLPAANFELATDWSSNGRWLLFQGENTTDGNFGVVDLKTQQLTWLVETPANEMGPSFSPDGKWIAFISNASGRPEAYVQAFEPGERPKLVGDLTLISDNGAQVLRWRGDGREICYLGMDGFLHSVPVAKGPRLQFGKPKTLFRMSVGSRAALPSAFGFDVSADGRRFLVPVGPEPAASSLVVIQNWESLLDKH